MSSRSGNPGRPLTETMAGLKISMMRLYLVQHGEANPEDIDPQRTLTDKGIDDVERVAAYMARVWTTPVAQIVHSGKTRAAQTASILAYHLARGSTLQSADGLSPNDDPTIWANRLQSMEADTMLVGHLPHLARLAGCLLCGDPGKKVIQFQMAGVVCMRRTEGVWSVEWMITPAVIP